MQRETIIAFLVGLISGLILPPLATTIFKRLKSGQAAPSQATADSVKKRQQLNALDSFKDWSNYMLVTTVAALGWLLSQGLTIVPANSCAVRIAIGLLCASMVFAIFTLAMIPIIAQAIDGSTNTFYDVKGCFKLFPVVGPTLRLPIKAVCWLQHVFFMSGVLTVAVAAVLLPGSPPK